MITINPLSTVGGFSGPIIINTSGEIRSNATASGIGAVYFDIKTFPEYGKL